MLAVLLLLARAAAAQMYSSGIGKTTHLVSDAAGTLDWMLTHLDATHDTGGLECTSLPGSEYDQVYCACGQAGRVKMRCPGCQDGPSTLSLWGFGLHAISYNSSAPHSQRPTPRPVGPVGIAAVESRVTQKLEAAAKAGGYDALLDLNTGFWVADLDPYILLFAKSGARTLPLEWADRANNRRYYSLLVQAASSYVLLEFMSARQTLLPAEGRYVAPLPRFLFKAGEAPDDVFPPLNATDPRGLPVPRPARISQFTSNRTRDARFYSQAFGRDVSGVIRGGRGVSALVLSFADMSVAPNYLQLHLVQRPRGDARQKLESAAQQSHPL